MRPWWSGVLTAGRRQERAAREHEPPPLRHLVADELRAVARNSLDPVKLVAAVVVATGVLAALGPLTPGPVVPGGWRIAVATVLGVVAAIVAHGLLQRSARPRTADDPLPALRAIIASAALLLGGTILITYVLAAVADVGGTAATDRLSAQLTVDRPLLVGSALLVGGVLAAAAGARLRLPGTLLFLALGMLLGDDGLDLISLADPFLVQTLGIAALVVILFEGGLTTTPDELRRGAAPGVLLATVGVVITAGITAIGAMVLLDVPSRVAWLLGAVVASTDAAAVFDLLRRAPLPPRLAAMLKVESGVNDPVAVLLTVGLLATWTAEPSAAAWLGFGALQLIGGAAVGFAAGWVGAVVFRRIPVSPGGLYPILGLAVGGLTYGVATFVGASGLLATYLAGIVLAAELPRRRRALREFHTALANGVEIGLFLMLGLLVFPSQLPAVAITALGVAVLLALIGRPVAAAVSLAPLGFSMRSIVAVSWLGMRGAVPIVLATLAFSAGIPGASLIFNIVFFVVLTSALAQGTTAVWLLRRLGLTASEAPGAVIADALRIEGTHLDLVEVVLDRESSLVGRVLRDLPAPPDALVVAVIRGERVLVPRGDTRLRSGDMLIVTTADPTHGIATIERWARAGA